VHPLEAGCEGISSTKGRERIARSRRWEHLVPAAIVGLVSQIYGKAASS